MLFIPGGDPAITVYFFATLDGFRLFLIVIWTSLVFFFPTRWHLLHVCLVLQMFAPQQAHRTAVNPKVDKLGTGAAAVRCERAGEATTRDDGASNMKA